MKLCSNKTYDSVYNLIGDMKTQLIASKPASALSTQLHSARQGNKSIEEYVKSIESLLVGTYFNPGESC